MLSLPKILPDHWWSMEQNVIFTALGTRREGLTQDEAERRLHTVGYNIFATQKKQNILQKAIAKIFTPLNMILLFAGGVSAVVGQISDFLIIVVMMGVSVCLDVFQEHQAIEGAEKLKKRVSLTTTVWRDGIKKEIRMSHIVPGDIISVAVGDIVPADCLLLSSTRLMINQSSLTGESFPQQKQANIVVKADTPLTERINCLWMGTDVVTGEGQAIVINTGNSTQIGKVAASLSKDRDKTEFERGIGDFGTFLMRITIFFSIFVFIFHFFAAHDVLSSLLFVLALAVGFAPELLPLIITINLSKGALRMSHKGVIVKHLPAIENFGSMDVLCTDKTGTLTENRIVLELYENINGQKDMQVLQYGYITSLFQHGFRGPMEDAVLAHHEVEHHGYTHVETIPFDFFRKRVSVIVAHRSKHILITKGAPEEILPLLTQYEVDGKVLAFSSAALAKAKRHFEEYGKEGFRVLAVAYKEIHGHKEHASPTDEYDLTLLGFMAFLDPPKKSAAIALKAIIDKGISICVLTGDNELVTEHVCRELGLPLIGVMDGKTVAHLSEEALRVQVEKTTVFARLNPEEKERIIRAIRANNHVVGYLGDGINDAPSLRAADIGISVNNGTDVAKDSADIILLHKDLHVLHDGVIEGRKTFVNVMKYLKMGISSSFGNMFSVAIASLFLPFLPMLPVQILLNDLLYDVSQLMLVNDSVDAKSLEKPRRWNIHSIRRFMMIFGPISSLFDIFTFFILFSLMKASPALFQTGWFLESLLSQTVVIFSIRTIITPFFRSTMSRTFALSLGLVIVGGMLLPFSPIAPLFGFVRPPTLLYICLFGVIILYVFVVEIVKHWFYKRWDL